MKSQNVSHQTSLNNCLAALISPRGENCYPIYPSPVIEQIQHNKFLDVEMMYDNILPEDREMVKTACITSADIVFRIKRTDGTIRWIKMIKNFPSSEKDDHPTAQYSITDITDSKELERQKNEFITTVSHELKTPITSIKAYSQFLKKALAGPEHIQNMKFLSRMEVQINRVEVLIKDLLDITRLECGKLVLRPVKFQLNKVVKDILSDLQLVTPTHKLVFSKSKLFSVFADVERISEVIINLVTNAVKYSPLANKVCIALKLEENSKVVFSVKDFGIGIAKENQSSVFKRFNQVLQKNNNAELSLGLGLYFSKEIIALSGGSMWFKSKTEKPTTFYFNLPACQL